MEQSKEDKFVFWLNLSNSFSNRLKDYITKSKTQVLLKEATFRYFPEFENKCQLISIDINDEFLQWQRWYIQLVAHHLKSDGLLFILAPNLPDFKSGVKAFLKNILRWFLWKLAILTQSKFLKEKLFSSSIMGKLKTYGLEVINFPNELSFLKGHGFVFKKNEIAEIAYKKKLEEYNFLQEEIAKNYADRILDFSSIKKDGLIKLKNNYKNVLVLAPHPDDELVGCGGTLLKLAASGATIHIIQMTEGVSSKGLQYESDSEKRKLRWEEASAVADKFNFKQYYWKTGIDTKLKNTDDEQDQLKILIDKIKPDLIFVPAATDRHDEHRIAFSIFDEVIKNTNYTSNLLVLTYPVWGALNEITHFVEVNEFTSYVLEAMYLYKIAMKPEDYNRRMLAIWAYQGEILNDDSAVQTEIYCQYKHIAH